jgi:ADP-heptose:LPS heptosyltransferase
VKSEGRLAQFPLFTFYLLPFAFCLLPFAFCLLTCMRRILRLFFLCIIALLAQPWARRAAHQPRRLLYIKPDHLGDLLLATPVLQALREACPHAEITALVGPWSHAVLARNPHVDRLLICPFPGFERTKDEGRRTKDRRILEHFSSFVIRLVSLMRPYALLMKYAALLRAHGYDVALIGRDDHWWGAALALLAGGPVRVGFAVPECRPFLSHALAWDPHAHVTQQGLDLVAAVSRRRSAGGSQQASTEAGNWQLRYTARFDPAPGDLAWADAWLHAQGITADQQLVIIHPGTGGPTKLWLPERWSAVGDALQALPNVRLVLTGGPGEAALVHAVADGMAQPPMTLAGQTTVGQLAALLRRAALVIGVDSGPMHLAAAQGTPTIHLYGPGDAGRFGPWGDPARHVVVRAGVWCSPCGVFSACPRGLAVPTCMAQIEAEEVVHVAGNTLKRTM